MVTHNPNLTSYASRVITMLDGKIASDTKAKNRVARDKAPKVSLNQKLRNLKTDTATKKSKTTKKSTKKKVTTS
jgi:ABC-type thiamine transport system ATPase subunit